MTLLAILRRELASYLVAPAGWLLAALFLLVQGCTFYLVVELLNRPEAPHGAVLQLFFGGTFLYWLFVIAVVSAITMRMLAEERRSGTIEMLLTAPVTETAVVLGKYLAGLCFYALLWLPTLVYVAMIWLLAAEESIAVGPVAASYLGVLLTGAGCLAVGLLASSLVKHQAVAALATFVALALLLLVGPLELFVNDPTLRAVIAHVNLFDQMDDFARGVVDSRRIVFDLSLAIFCLVAAVLSLRRRKWS